MDLILLFPITWGRIPLYSFIIRRGIVDQLTVPAKARAVAGAIPGVLGFVVFESATEVRTSRRGGCQKPDGRLKSIYGKLWAQGSARGGENRRRRSARRCFCFPLMHQTAPAARHFPRSTPYSSSEPLIWISFCRFDNGYTHIAAQKSLCG